MLNLQQVIDLMKKAQGSRTNREFAEFLGISPQYLGDIYLGNREPGERALEKLKITKRVLYEKSA